MLNNYHLFRESQDLIGKYEKVMMSHREKREGDHKGHSEVSEERSFGEGIASYLIHSCS